MSYGDTLLATGERVVYRGKQHWFVLVWNARFALLGLLIAVVLFFLGGGLAPDGVSGGLRTLLGWVTLILVVGGLIWTVWSFFRWQSQEYLLTNRRVIQAEGVINKKATDSSLEKINDAVLTQNWIGRVFGFGDLEVLTASDIGVDQLRMLVDATDFKKAMLEAKYDHERELAGPDAEPAAPRRDCRVDRPGDARSGGPGARHRPRPPPPRRPRSAMSSEDVTATLSRPGRPARPGRDQRRRVRGEEGRAARPAVSLEPGRPGTIRGSRSRAMR